MKATAARLYLPAALSAILCGLMAAPAMATSAGALRSIQPSASASGESGKAAQGDQFDIDTDTGMRLRISVLGERLLRIQAGIHELPRSDDKGAPIVLTRKFEAVATQYRDLGERVEIATAGMVLRIRRQPLRFELAAVDAGGKQRPLWRELQPLQLDDTQAVQVLSSNADEAFFGGGQQNGAFAFKGKELQISYSGGWDEGDRPSPAPMLLSSHGWGMLRNSWVNGVYDLRQPEQSTLLHQEPGFDAYYFVGDDLHQLLDAYTDLTGRAHLLPRWAFEYGDADCYNDHDNRDKPGSVPDGWHDGPTGTTPDVVDAVAKKYREYNMPGGWILPNDGYGCGYVNLPETVRGLAEFGFKTGLWTENGVDKIAWEVSKAGTRAQKLDVAWTGKGYQFAMDANRQAYDGILDNSDARPFLWTVMGWAGIQRYAVAWTGDQSSSWDYIRWHIPTLIGSGLSGMAYANGDVDAIFGGSAETFTRDLQWKSFTPVLMGMSGWASAARKHPWWYDEPYRSINRDYLLLKQRMMPYMYTLARAAEQSGAPLVRGLMWDYPNDPHANDERYKYQFLLGRDLLIAPVYRSQGGSGGWRRDIHLPQGRWIDYWDGRSLTADAKGRQVDRKIDLKTTPVFVRAGAIIPMYPAMLYDGEKPKDTLTLDLYPQGRSSYTVYEDDGITRRYRDGEHSQQQITVQAPEQGRGDVRVDIGEVDGTYQGQEPRRHYELRLLSPQAPHAVQLGGQTLQRLPDRVAYEGAAQGWFFAPEERGGSVYAKTGLVDIRQPQQFQLRIAATPVEDGAFPAAPEPGRKIPADSLLVIGRPAEEPGQALEQAFDDDPKTWFRTIRNQAVRTGPHEWTISLGERRLLDGIELAPRNDKNWKHGQVRDYAIYMADNNGDWGEPIKRGTLPMREGMQTIDFTPHAGRLLRFRALSLQNPESKDGSDSTTGDDTHARARAFDATQPTQIGPMALATFHLLEHRPPERPSQQQYLSDLALPAALGNAVGKDRALGGANDMRMNGLLFRKGLGVGAQSRIDLRIDGNWNTLRADLGIDDSCKAAGGLHFQIWGDDRLVYDSGPVKAPGVVKPEIDVRGMRRLSLRTLGAAGAQPDKVCGNWGNAMLQGLQGDKAEIVAP